MGYFFRVPATFTMAFERATEKLYSMLKKYRIQRSTSRCMHEKGLHEEARRTMGQMIYSPMYAWLGASLSRHTKRDTAQISSKLAVESKGDSPGKTGEFSQ